MSEGNGTLTILDQFNKRTRAARASAEGPGPTPGEAASRKLRTRSGFDELSSLFRSDDPTERMRVFVLAMLALDLGSQEQTLFSVEAMAERFLDFLGDSVMARTIGLALHEAGEIRPFAVRVAGRRAETTEMVTALMRLAAESREPVMTPDIRHEEDLGETPSVVLKPASVPAVAVPLIVGGDVVAVFYVDRDPGSAPLDAELGYLKMIAAVAAWPFRASQENQELTAQRDRAHERARDAQEKEREAREEAQEAQEEARRAREEADRAREEAREARKLIRETEERGHFKGIVGESPAMLMVKSEMLNLAEVDITLLLLGETGVGKTSVAAALHKLPGNTRRDGPLKVVDVTTIPENLVEAELFGCTQGAFTGATTREGLVLEAHRGTLFLDEIGELPKPLQAKLLRLLDARSARKVGSNRDYEVDVRIIAATNKDLKAMVAEGNFREDLYYRLAQYTLVIPPLRDRREDLPLLVDHLFRELRTKMRRPELQLEPEVVALLAEYRWPGNVRELKGVLEKLIVQTRKPRVGVADLPPEIRSEQERPAGLQEATDEYQRGLVRGAMVTAGGNATRAAEILGLKHPQHLYQICKRLGLKADELREQVPAVARGAR